MASVLGAPHMINGARSRLCACARSCWALACCFAMTCYCLHLLSHFDTCSKQTTRIVKEGKRVIVSISLYSVKQR